MDANGVAELVTLVDDVLSADLARKIYDAFPPKVYPQGLLRLLGV